MNMALYKFGILLLLFIVLLCTVISQLYQHCFGLRLCVFKRATLTRNVTDCRNLPRRSLVTIAVQRRAVDPSITVDQTAPFQTRQI